MNILVANDDGIKAEGIRRLAAALGKEGDVYVFAPDRQRSASSHALTIGNNLTITREDFPGVKEAYSVDGTPADCVKLGIYALHERDIEIDIVYSGINHGGNLGSDTMYSGTVSAAAEGAFLGKPAVAVSVASHEPEHFDAACSFAERILPFAMKAENQRKVISINTPDLPEKEIKGVTAATLGVMQYEESFNVVEKTQNSVTYRYSGKPMDSPDWNGDTDALLVKKGYAVISMIKYDLNDYQGLEEIKKWEIKL
ncbi:MAG: 5'/3'-nucleotidase SurE [Anaerovoracaceae bacterium]